MAGDKPFQANNILNILMLFKVFGKFAADMWISRLRNHFQPVNGRDVASGNCVLGAPLETNNRILMDQDVQKSCWSVTVWTVLALGGALALIYLVGESDAAEMVAMSVR